VPRGAHLSQHDPRRPGPWWVRGVVVLTTLLLGGCGGPTEVDAPDLTGDDADACAAFVDALPAELAGEERGEVTPDDAPAAAYGDPAIVVECGVAAPEEFDATAQCEVVNDVGWYLPPDQYDDPDADLTITAVGFRPRVAVLLPADYRDDDRGAASDTAAALLAGLTDPVRDHLTEDAECQ